MTSKLGSPQKWRWPQNSRQSQKWWRPSKWKWYQQAGAELSQAQKSLSKLEFSFDYKLLRPIFLLHCLLFCGNFHSWGRLHLVVCLQFMGIFIFEVIFICDDWGRLHFGVVFISEVIFIFEVLFIFEVKFIFKAVLINKFCLLICLNFQVVIIFVILIFEFVFTFQTVFIFEVIFIFF